MITIEQVMVGVPPHADSQVTLSNYRINPFNAWAFRNAGGPLNVVMVPRGGDVRQLAEAPDSRIPSLVVPEEKRTVEQILSECYADGLVVVQGEDVLFERYYNGLSRPFQHIWFSATKSLASTALGILVADGRVELSKSPADYIPELKGSGFERVTVQNVLDHCSGIDFKENYEDPESDFLKYYGPAVNMAFMPGARDAQPGKTEIYGTHDFLGRFIKPDPKVTPGAEFDYNSANADVAGWLVARISSMPFNLFVHERIWSKIGCEHDAYIACDRAYQAVATGGMNSTLRDAARFGMMIRDRGQVRGETVVPAAVVDATLQVTADDRARMRHNPHYAAEPWAAYRNMWWVLDPDAGEYSAVGIHGQLIYVHRQKNVVIALFSSQPVAGNANYAPFTAKLRALRAISSLL